MPFLLGASPGSTENWGSKASRLHELWRKKYRVPPGFIILNTETVPEQSALARWVKTIGGFPVAVRSSAMGEDGANSSFAGQFESVLNVDSIEALEVAICEVRESTKSSRVESYLRDRVQGSDSSSSIAMNVLVQPMISALYSGVVFTLNPLNGREEEIVIELCPGTGDKLVSGQVNPFQYVFNWQTMQVVQSPEAAESIVSNRVIERIVQVSRKIQAEMGSPQDIEFCIGEDQQIWILQSRPITSFQPRQDTDDLTTADFRDGGVSARVCTPLMASIYGRHFAESMEKYAINVGLKSKACGDVAPESWFQVFYGRPYWNASTVKTMMSQIPGFDERVFDQDLGIQKEYTNQVPQVTPFTWRTLISGIRQFVLLEREFKKNIPRLSLLKDDLDEWIDDHKYRIENLHQLTDPEAHEFCREYFEYTHKRLEQEYFYAVYNNANGQMAFNEVVKLIEKVTKLKVDKTALLGNISEISHMKFDSQLKELHGTLEVHGRDSTEFEFKFNQFLDEMGFHCEAEYDLMAPRMAENREEALTFVLESFQSHKTHGRPIEQENYFKYEYRRIQRKLKNPLKPWNFLLSLLFRSQVKRVRNFIKWKERVRELSTRGYYFARLILLDLGRRFAEERKIFDRTDIFFLKYTEVLDLFSSTRSFPKSKIESRKLFYQGYRDFQPPEELFTQVHRQGDQSQLPIEGELTGLPCSHGVYRGRARVISSIKEIGLLQQGEILVTRFTDPGWTPALGKASGVVTEVGGILSHAAVISREFGIPAILNVKGATQKIQSGNMLEINGSSGIIRIGDVCKNDAEKSNSQIESEVS